MIVLKNNPKQPFWGFYTEGSCFRFCLSLIVSFLRVFDNISKQLILNDL
jgi:hypothetical protein